MSIGKLLFTPPKNKQPIGMTETYEQTRNKYCHEVLKALYENSDGTARVLTYPEMIDGKQGKLFSNRFFFNLNLSGLDKKLDVDDILLQEVCEFLELNNHIEAAAKTDKGIFEKIRFTSADLTAYKTNYYLKENKKITDDHWLKRSALFNNWTTPFIAAAGFIVALVTFLREYNCGQQPKVHALSNKDTVKVRLATSEIQVPTQAQYHLTGNSDAIPKQQKEDSLTKQNISNNYY